MPLRKELLVSTSTDDAPKTPALTDFPNRLVYVQKYDSYHRVEQQRYNDGQRPPPPSFKLKISPTWLESYFVSGCQKEPDGSKWKFDEINDKALFAM